MPKRPATSLLDSETANGGAKSRPRLDVGEPELIVQENRFGENVGGSPPPLPHRDVNHLQFLFQGQIDARNARAAEFPEPTLQEATEFFEQFEITRPRILKQVPKAVKLICIKFLNLYEYVGYVIDLFPNDPASVIFCYRLVPIDLR